MGLSSTLRLETDIPAVRVLVVEVMEEEEEGHKQCGNVQPQDDDMEEWISVQVG